MTPVSSWGRLSAHLHHIEFLKNPKSAAASIAKSPRGLAFGNGRSYGDACLNGDRALWFTRGMDSFISFDRSSGRLKCEAGILLKEIQDTTVPEGWMLPVTPGTQLITVGGAIANDIHGKNHHVMGSFGDHVVLIKIIRTDGEIIECGPQINQEWFAATLGGIGLTGVILEVELQLRPVSSPWLVSETIPYNNLDEFFELADTSEKDWEYTVSWIDCASRSGARGLFMRGNHSKSSSVLPNKKHTLNIPITPPVSLINQVSLKPLNAAYFWLNKNKSKLTPTYYQPFFYPLDNINNWNRLYGPKGFYQHQCVIPRDVGNTAITEMLDEIRRSGEGSFLAVLKTFGQRESVGMLSFPKPGVTLALDFPNHGLKTLSLLERLDNIVAQSKGRIYLAKDARMPRSLFESSYPKFQDFIKYRDSGISSEMSRRLFGK